MIHYVIERDENGQPARLVWSSEIQHAAERRDAEEAMERAAEAFQNALPMASMREWARKHGVIS